MDASLDPTSAPPSPAADVVGRTPSHGPAGRIPCRIRDRPGSLLHSGVSVRGFYLVHALGALVPVVAGIIFFGPRAAGTIALVLASAAIALTAWRSVGSRGRHILSPQALWMALLVALMLPPHLASSTPTLSITQAFVSPPWPIPAAAGFLVITILWMLGGGRSGRFHASLIAFLLLAVFFGSMLLPHRVLSRKHMVQGDILSANAPNLFEAIPEPWLRRPPETGKDSFWISPASQWLVLYTRGEIPVERGRMPLHELLRDRMPPLEDLVIGGHPAPIGSASLIAVIVGGLFLLYRGVIDFRIPLLIVLAMYAALLILPVPTVITDKAVFYRWLIPREPDVGWASAVTFVSYQMTAGPAVFMAFFLATSPSIRPLVRRARVVYAVLIGVATAAAQLYLSVSLGPYIALASIALIAPILDRWFRPKTLV